MLDCPSYSLGPVVSRAGAGTYGSGRLAGVLRQVDARPDEPGSVRAVVRTVDWDSCFLAQGAHVSGCCPNLRFLAFEPIGAPGVEPAGQVLSFRKLDSELEGHG